MTDEVTLRDHFDQRWADHLRQHGAEELARGAALAAQGRLVDAAFASSEKAIDKAEQAQQLRNEAGNEVRGQLADQASRFVTRSEHDSAVLAVRSELMAEIKALNAAHTTEKARADTDAGKGLGSSAAVAAIIAAIGVASAVVGMVVVLTR